MIINASGRSALIIAAGLFVLLASPVMATDDDDSTAGATADSQAAAPTTLHKTYRHALHHRRHYAHHKPPTIAKSDDDKKADGDGKAGDDKKAIVAGVATTTGDNRPLADIPPSIANANAQMLLAGAQISAAAAIPPGTNAPQTTDTPSADNGTVMVASDQLNDSDRTLEEGTSTTATAASSPPPPPATIAGDSSVWDQTSLIGKIFIGFGALLTMASAARMFIT
jgi:hypothetical protein